MKIGLIDVDGHNYPNLALMRISAYHKAQGDTVEWWHSDLEYFDIVYKSKIFSDAYSKDTPDPYNVGKLYKSGSGYAISLVDGKEVYDKSKDPDLPAYIERCFPDYSIYPQFDFAVSMTSRGCKNNCPWCHVGAKEGKCSVKVADVSDFWSGQKEIQVLDPNITAVINYADKRDLFRQYRETGAKIEFTQGLDIRLIDDADIQDINNMRISNIHFAWDNPALDLTEKFKYYAARAKHKPHGHYGMVYCLTNFGKGTVDEQIKNAMYRIETLLSLDFDPYIMIYNKPSADKRYKDLQRWCNSIRIRQSIPFSEYGKIASERAKVQIKLFEG